MAGKKKNTVSPVVIGIAAMLVILMIWGFWHQFQRLEEVANYKVCLEIQNDPSLQYACTCRPKALNASEDYDAVYEKTEALCICECQVSENRTETFEIRKARTSQETTYQRVP